VIHSLVRARGFASNMAESAGIAEPAKAFLMGLFSMLMRCWNLPLADALNQSQYCSAHPGRPMGKERSGNELNILYSTRTPV